MGSSTRLFFLPCFAEAANEVGRKKSSSLGRARVVHGKTGGDISTSGRGSSKAGSGVISSRSFDVRGWATGR